MNHAPCDHFLFKSSLSLRNRHLIRAADQLHRDTMIDDSLWHALADRYNTHQRMDMVFTVGQYRLVSAALNWLCVQLDDDLEPFAVT
jgi:hypothetical protein